MAENTAGSYRKAYVYIQGRYAGSLSENDKGYCFSYDETYLTSPGALAASLTLPLEAVNYESTTLFPFFDGLIPEGWLLDVVTRNWKINRHDRFGILLAACRDSVGDVSVRIEKEEL